MRQTSIQNDSSTSLEVGPPKLDKSQQNFMVLGLLLGVFLAALDQTIISAAGPTIQYDLKISTAVFPWLTTSYLLAITIMAPIWGKLSDLYGRKSMFLLGVGIFLLGSILCGISQSSIQLILFRGLQGLGGGALFAVSFAIIADVFPAKQRTRIAGMFGMLFGISGIIGPVIGGYLTDNASWHWIFFVNVPIGALALALSATKMPALKRNWGSNRPKMDWLGVFWLALSSTCLLCALSLGKVKIPEEGGGFLWFSWQILGLLALCAIGVVNFILTERRVKDPLIDLKLFENRSFSWGTLGTFVMNSTFLSAIVFLPLYTVHVVSLTATRSGLTILPLSLGLILANIISSQIAARIGKIKPIILVALSISLISFTLMGFTLTTRTTPWDISWKMFLLGVGLGPGVPLFTVVIQNAVKAKDIGMATAIAIFSRALGTTVGVAILGSIFAAAVSSGIDTRVESIKLNLNSIQQEQFESIEHSVHSQNTLKEEFPDFIKIRARTSATFKVQNTLIFKALRDNDPVAIRKILADSQMPPKLRNILAAGGFKASIQKSMNAPYQNIARAIRTGNRSAFMALRKNPKLPLSIRQELQLIPLQSLQNSNKRVAILQKLQLDWNKQVSIIANTALKTTLKSMITKNQVINILNRIDLILKQELTNNIRQIYQIAIIIMILAWIITFLMPETSMRKDDEVKNLLPQYE
jgi:EmrB/QacA subfamily drug resistance transporter